MSPTTRGQAPCVPRHARAREQADAGQRDPVLSGRERHRVRQGHYRVRYSIDDALSRIVVVKIGQRGDV
jgi:mRNA-degrading endonuclease RelE of RelBE toxin-antitoxin system